MNLNAYVTNAPLRLVDPDGREEEAAGNSITYRVVRVVRDEADERDIERGENMMNDLISGAAGTVAGGAAGVLTDNAYIGGVVGLATSMAVGQALPSLEAEVGDVIVIDVTIKPADTDSGMEVTAEATIYSADEVPEDVQKLVDETNADENGMGNDLDEAGEVNKILEDRKEKREGH